MRRTYVLGMIVVAGVVAAAAANLGAQQQPAAGGQAGRGGGGGPALGKIEKVADNLYFIFGAGGNTAVYIAEKGVVLVDTKNPDNGQGILDQVKSVTDKPITHIINTHTHGDHNGSNVFFPASVEIVSQENTAANMQKMAAFQEALNRHGLPDRTFKDKMTVLSGKDAIDLYYFGPAHTNGDAFVVFRNARVVHAGDAFANKGQPLIDRNNGGSGIAYPETIAKAAKGIGKVDIVINGHDHIYERFAPQDAQGKVDLERGIRQVLVGTGGSGVYLIKKIAPNSEIRDNSTYGVLKMTLKPGSYAWDFIPIGGQKFRDSGTGTCSPLK